MLNYSNLNDVEFEYLCQDIMQKKLGIELRRFAKGRDGGIDLADDVHFKNIIVQVKHYTSSSVSQLIATLKEEAIKVSKLSPKEYYVCCSKELSPQKIDEIYQLFSDYMTSTSNIVTLNDIDDFLNDPVNIEILKKHYKLWIESTGILQEVTNTNIFLDCETLLADIEDEKKLFVNTSAFTAALRCLENNKPLFITGNPGVGKTITSKMLVLHYAAMGYRVRFSTNISDLNALKNSLSRNPEIKEIILVDDCFGQAYFRMKESQNDELLSLINYVNSSTNKLLILNSRITILQEAKARKPELLKCFEGERCSVYILDMNSIGMVEKARILYNHISFNEMDEEYFSEIKKDQRYYQIIMHPNYTPRIIEFICNPNRYKKIPSNHYFEFAMRQLDNPKEIWKDEYERRLEKVDRLLLLTLYSFSDLGVDEEKVKTCFERRISCESDIDITINQYEASLSRLLDSFVQLVVDKGTKKLAMVNPSVNDYLDGRLQASQLEREQLINSATHIQQKKRLLSEEEFESFILSVLINHEIDKFIFDNKYQKNALIAFYCSKYNILDDTYSIFIRSFLNDPCFLFIFGNEYITPFEIFREILRKDVCDYYNIKDFLVSECELEQTLSKFIFDELVEAILLVDRFFEGDSRNAFVDIAIEQLGYAVQAYCDDLDAEEFDPDVFHAIEMSRYFNGDYEDIDVLKAASYIKDEIILIVEKQIESQLSLLPEDIGQAQDFIDNLLISVYGAEELVNSYLEYDGYDYDDYRESRGEYSHSSSEIEYIFERNKD